MNDIADKVKRNGRFSLELISLVALNVYYFKVSSMAEGYRILNPSPERSRTFKEDTSYSPFSLGERQGIGVKLMVA
jgi:hypothetical protein